eukprot:162305-Pyramimonas_sp.AAC.1
MLPGANMRLLLDEPKGITSAGSFFRGATDAPSGKHARSDAQLVRRRWPEVVAEASAAGGRGAHA